MSHLFPTWKSLEKILNDGDIKIRKELIEQFKTHLIVESKILKENGEIIISQSQEKINNSQRIDRTYSDIFFTILEQDNRFYQLFLKDPEINLEKIEEAVKSNSNYMINQLNEIKILIKESGQKFESRDILELLIRKGYSLFALEYLIDTSYQKQEFIRKIIDVMHQNIEALDFDNPTHQNFLILYIISGYFDLNNYKNNEFQDKSKLLNDYCNEFIFKLFVELRKEKLKNNIASSKEYKASESEKAILKRIYGLYDILNAMCDHVLFIHDNKKATISGMGDRIKFYSHSKGKEYPSKQSQDEQNTSKQISELMNLEYNRTRQFFKSERVKSLRRLPLTSFKETLDEINKEGYYINFNCLNSDLHNDLLKALFFDNSSNEITDVKQKEIFEEKVKALLEAGINIYSANERNYLAWSSVFYPLHSSPIINIFNPITEKFLKVANPTAVGKSLGLNLIKAIKNDNEDFIKENLHLIITALNNAEKSRALKIVFVVMDEIIICKENIDAQATLCNFAEFCKKIEVFNDEDKKELEAYKEKIIREVEDNIKRAEQQRKEEEEQRRREEARRLAEEQAREAQNANVGHNNQAGNGTQRPVEKKITTKLFELIRDNKDTVISLSVILTFIFIFYTKPGEKVFHKIFDLGYKSANKLSEIAGNASIRNWRKDVTETVKNVTKTL
ncbi:MAG: hypothetical protein J0H68_02135 [Sphingobacteriia bacterium]|nr:hypothetical protein [Sphingobacteriia bacterium]